MKHYFTVIFFIVFENKIIIINNKICNNNDISTRYMFIVGKKKKLKHTVTITFNIFVPKLTKKCSN